MGASNRKRSGRSTPNALAELRDYLRGQQRMAAQIKEIIMDAHLLNA